MPGTGPDAVARNDPALPTSCVSPELAPQAMVEILLRWEKELHEAVLAWVKQQDETGSWRTKTLQDVIGPLQKAVLARFENVFCTATLPKPRWAELLVWAEGVDLNRPALFSGRDPDDDDYLDWLYNKFFRYYYEYGFKNFESLSQLHYDHGLKTDFVFYFSSDDPTEIPEDPRLWKHTVRLSDIAAAAAEGNEIRAKLRAEFDRDRNSDENFEPFKTDLDRILRTFVEKHSQMVSDMEVRQLTDELLQPARLSNPEAQKTLVAGLFLAYFFIFLGRKQVDEETAIYWLRSDPTLTEARLKEKRKDQNKEPTRQARSRSVETSFILAFPRALRLDEVNTFRLTCRITQQVMAEAISSAFLTRKANEAALLAAAAAILSRNLSHNIGSHVIPRATVPQIQLRINEISNAGDVSPDDALMIAGRLKTTLDDYIRQKSDFLAELTTGLASSASTAMLYRDVVLPFQGNTLLMDCLAANEGVQYSDWDTPRLKLKFISDVDDFRFEFQPDSDGSPRIPYGHRHRPDGEDLSLTVQAHPIGRVKDGSAPRDVGDEQDVAVALPGALGQFAIYGILENLIRNAAKHNRAKFDEDPSLPLCITLRLVDDSDSEDPGALRLLIYDNVSDPTPDLVTRLQAHLRDDIVDETKGSVRGTAWGMAEIVICANLLSGSTSFWYDPKSIRVDEGQTDDSNERCGRGMSTARLVFDLRLPRARQALFCGPKLCEFVQNREDPGWQRRGINWFSDENELKEHLLSRNDSTVSFQFAVLDEAVAEKVFASDDTPSALHAALPFRIVTVGAADDGVGDFGELNVKGLNLGDKTLEPADVDRVMATLWHTWSRRWLDLSRRYDDQHQAIVAVNLEDIPDHWLDRSETIKTYADPKRSILFQLMGKNAKSAPPQTDHPLPAVLFDRHGSIDTTNVDKRRSCYVPFDKRNDDFLVIYDPRFPSDAEWFFPYELFEAGQLGILVIDERIAERSLALLDSEDTTLQHISHYVHPYEAEMPVTPCLWHVALAARVFIATHFLLPADDGSMSTLEIALHGKSYQARETLHAKGDGGALPACPSLKVVLDDKGAVAVNTYGPTFGKAAYAATSEIDIIVIHQGMLDVVCKRRPGLKDSDVLARLRNIAKWVVVESGRGVPPEVQTSGEKFLPFSALDRSFGTGRVAKLTLSKRLMERARHKGPAR